jgi:hypothetical protein
MLTANCQTNDFFNPEAFFESIFNSFNQMFKNVDDGADYWNREYKKKCCGFSDCCCEALCLVVGIFIIASVIIYAFDPYGIIGILQYYVRWTYDYVSAMITADGTTGLDDWQTLEEGPSLLSNQTFL